MKLTKALASCALAAATLPGIAAQTSAPSSSGTAVVAASHAEQQLRSRELTPAQQKLKTLRTIFIYSDTVYLDSKVLRDALTKRFEIRAWNIDLGEKNSADVSIKVWRPTFTFDWRYRITDSKTGQELGAGRIVAWDGKRAADALAADIARTIGRVRPLPTPLLGALAEDPNARNWEMQYHDGSEGPRKGVKMTISVSPERIVGRHERRVAFVIPAQSISKVSYNPRTSTSDPSKRWDAFWTSAFNSVDDPNSAMGALMLIPVALAGGAILKHAGKTTTEHFCEIAWSEDTGSVIQVRDVVLRGESQTVKDFMAAVEEVSHRKASDVAAETDALQQAIERDDLEGRFAVVQLDKKAAVGWKILQPGAYRVVLVQRDPQALIAYFLPGPGAASNQESTMIAAQMPVLVEPRVAPAGEPAVRYRESGGITTIEEIATADKVLHFRAIPLQFAAAPQVSEDMEEVLAQAALKPKYRSLYVKSDTVYLKNEAMVKALAQHPAFAEWQINLAPPQSEAELTLVVKRPFLTFDWTYLLTEVKTGKKVVEGKITARDGGRAASLIADHIVDALKAQAAQETRNEAK